ncbi:YadA-like family protein [Xenorhabdus bovienii]|uniref:YadA-like family protein n=1 Tax=Xenorhabdus bovienii TaxID=40576 RepID=UPI0023B3168D|nr:YadA-like family protein [Xenorhabdus bovienii]MDE9487583.1 YadA-like family protein [Xenorhabdus bovienii]MDE9536658.1 YadA-like family protein [Xenorhabdus bovienii]MDE9589631.1 YadA-like family protein [Xenorhabdus bovienii]
MTKSILAVITAATLSISPSFAETNINSGGDINKNKNVAGESIAIGTNNDLGGATKGTVLGHGGKLINSNQGVVIGSGTVSDGNGVAVGGGESKNGGIAIGSGSKAERADEMNIGNRQVTDVKDGIADTDAANFGQLNQTAKKTLEEANKHTDTVSGELGKSLHSHLETTEKDVKYHTDKTANGVKEYVNEQEKNTLDETTLYTNKTVSKAFNDSLKSAKDYTDDRYNQLNKKLTHNYNRANAGISGAMAMSAIPQKFGYEKSVGIAVSSYRGQGALAVGAEWNTSARTVTRFNTSLDTQGGVGVAAGLAFGAN